MKAEAVEIPQGQQHELTQRIEVDWTQSEWFEVWLRLARHEPIEPKEAQMAEAA